ncbi:hypothetical protein [Kutzneria sp. NPDC052558]|uniref:hypothetical protein n=1 Tax=Kutzneria sp. NPDC052558 TaxID=3364121 RepID=UPI0037CA50B1
MARNDVRVVLDSGALAEVLRSPEIQTLITGKAGEVANLVRARGYRVRDGRPLPVEVITEAPTDRAAATVAITHPAGVGMEARHGVLRRAAEAAGLEVIGLDAKAKTKANTTRRRSSRRGRKRGRR